MPKFWEICMKWIFSEKHYLAKKTHTQIENLNCLTTTKDWISNSNLPSKKVSGLDGFTSEFFLSSLLGIRNTNLTQAFPQNRKRQNTSHLTTKPWQGHYKKRKYWPMSLMNRNGKILSNTGIWKWNSERHNIAIMTKLHLIEHFRKVNVINHIIKIREILIKLEKILEN